jgi:threonylcarbamoyladenosine tRNA methylthiotransferase MtaB
VSRKDIELHTYGCKVNTYDSSILEDVLSKSQLGDHKVHIINSCAVTKEASTEALRRAKRIKSKDKEAKVVMTGCAAQVDTEMFTENGAVDLIVANSHKSQLPSLLKDLTEGSLVQRVFKGDIFAKEEFGTGGGVDKSHSRAFLKIQDGCNSFCTFCVIPFARGKSRSLKVSELVRRVHEFEDSGIKEVVITGVHIGDYEANGKKLEDLVEAFLLQTKIPRIRISSLEPIEISERLLDCYQDPRMAPHFHMSIQAASDQVLKDMKRKYGRKEVVESLHRLRERVPNCFIGMDVIAGFPTETEELFFETYQALNESPWTRMHVFPYSERPGTYAARLKMSQPRSVRTERARRLRELSEERYKSELVKQVGKKKRVMILNSPTNGCIGLSDDYWPIDLEFGPTDKGQLVNVLVKETIENSGRFVSGLKGERY